MPPPFHFRSGEPIRQVTLFSDSFFVYFFSSQYREEHRPRDFLCDAAHAPLSFPRSSLASKTNGEIFVSNIVVLYKSSVDESTAQCECIYS